MSTIEKMLAKRRSIRGFLPDAVPAEVLQEVFTIAQQSPSNCNTQPWRTFVVSGERRNTVCKALYESAANNVPPNPDFGMEPKYQNEYRQRQMDCAYALYDSIDVVREDKEGRLRALLRNFTFFDAPHAAFIMMPKTFGVSNGVDLGIYLQTLMLTMSQHGIASCAQGALNLYPDVVKELLDIDKSLGVVVGLSFGYEDEGAPVNNARTTRVSLNDAVSFYQ